MAGNATNARAVPVGDKNQSLTVVFLRIFGVENFVVGSL